MSGAGIPNPTESIITARDNHGAVAIKVNGGDRIGVGRQNLETFSGLNVPNPDSLVKSARDDHIGLRVEVDTEHVIGVAD